MHGWYKKMCTKGSREAENIEDHGVMGREVLITG